MGKFNINRKLAPMKAHYFFFNAGTAPLMPYIPVYARQLGISQIAVSLMYTVFPFIALLSKPTFGAVADHFRIRKPIFMLCIATTAIFFFCIQFIPKNSQPAYANFDCGTTESFLRSCNISDTCALTNINTGTQENQTMTCKLTCSNPESSFLDELCHTFNVSEACGSTTDLVEFSTTSVLNKGLHESSCLYFPVSRMSVGSQDYPYPSCGNSSSAYCRVECDSPTYYSYVQLPIDESESSYSIQFQILFGLMAASWASQAVVVSLADSICFNLLGDKVHNFGEQRLWGALGWGLFAILSGYFIDLASIGKPEKDYTPSFYLVAALLTINLISVSRIRVDYNHTTKTVWKDVGRILKNVRVLLFLFSCFAFGVCIALIWNFLFWYLEDLAKASGCGSLEWIKLLEGLAMGVQCFMGEAPFLFISGWFLNKLGHVRTMTLILVAMGVRMIAYSFLVNPWLTLPIELLNGLTLGLYWSTSASYASVVGPPGAASTMQGIVGAVFEGLGTSTGSLVGGQIYTRYGGSVTFLSYGIFVLVAAVIFFVSHLILGDAPAQRRESYSRVPKEMKDVIRADIPAEEQL